MEDKELPQYRFLEYNLLSSLKIDDLWLQFMEAIARELYLEREKMTETRYLYDYSVQLQDGIINDSEMFGYTPNLIVDNSLEMLRKEYESIPFRIRNKTNYNGYNIIFKQISKLGEVYNFYWNNDKFIRAILSDDIIEYINNNTISYSEPFYRMDADKNFSSISSLEKITLDSGYTLDQKIGKKIWRLDKNAGITPTKHLGLEYYSDKVYTKNDNTYLITSEFFEYLLQGAMYTKRCPIIPHIGIQVSSFLYETEGYDYFNLNGEFSIPDLQLRSCCGFNYMKGFTKEEKFILDTQQTLDNLVNYKLDADVEGTGRPSTEEFKYISCGSGSLPTVQEKYKDVYQYNKMMLFYTFSDDDGSDEIKDYSQNYYNATVYGNTKKIEGIVGKSVDLDGSTYVKSNSNLIIINDNFTFGFWIKPYSQSSDDRICAIDFDFLKVYYDYDVGQFEIEFNGQTYYISAEQNINYNILFEFNTDDNLLNIYVNSVLEESIDISSVTFAGQYPLYIGTNSNIENDEDELKFIGIIDDLYIMNKIYTEDEIQYLYNTKYGIITHLGNKLAEYELDDSSEITETDLWTLISSQVSCNDIRNEFGVRIGDEKTYIGYTNFSPIKSKTFNFTYLKDLVFTTEEIKVYSDANGDFYYLDDNNAQIPVGGHIDYNTGLFILNTYVSKSIKNKSLIISDTIYDEIIDSNCEYKPNTITVTIYFNDGVIKSYTDNGEGHFEGEGVVSSDINYTWNDSLNPKVNLVLSNTDYYKVIISYDYDEDMDMLKNSNVYFNYKTESSDKNNIKEIAIENVNHEILAYMTFPPIQSYNEYNYVSANFFIRKIN